MLEERIPSGQVADGISKIIANRGTEYFSDARTWLAKSGLGAGKVEEAIVKKIVETLSRNLTEGLLELTVDEIANEKEYKDAVEGKREVAVVAHLEKELPPFIAYVEFIVKSGPMEIKKIRYDFKVEPTVEVRDARITIVASRVRSVAFGSLIVSVTLDLLRGDQDMELGSFRREWRLTGPIIL